MKKPTPSKEKSESREQIPEKTAEKVPEWAENMEHTLRRLTRAKQKERSKKPGLYR